MEDLKLEDMCKWIVSEPTLIAKGSDKFEDARFRPIYGTAPLDYTVMSFATTDMERSMHVLPGIECGLNGMAETAAMLRRLEVRTPGMLGTMVDSENFNTH